MIGNHCIKAWSKTQSVIAKSSAESELYSVVKGAMEGLGLITLCRDLGAAMGARLNLDATAAKGILDRQGIAKVRHIDVAVLWLQQQAAKQIMPLIKVDGSDNCADLLTKRLGVAVMQRHVDMMQLDFRDGRAKQAARLHAIGRLDPQKGFQEGGVGDRWEVRGENCYWIRVHKTPRAAAFTPHKIPHGPGRKSRLSVVRETIGIDETGKTFALTDDWTAQSKPRATPHRWTGITIFRSESFDDLNFGGDQRRQRDRVGEPESQPPRARVSWADTVDD